MISLGIIICTYQRPDKLRSLIKNILLADPLPQEIIVVDASPETYQTGKDEQGVRIIKSNHANQPYQRYVGYLAAKSDVLLYLDDDMEIVHPNFINVVLNIFIQRPQISGVALHFTNKQLINALSDIPTSNLFRKNGMFKRFKNKLSGYPDLPAGQLGWCGNRGPQPAGGGFTQWLSGGAFVAKRNCLYQNFNFQLFDLFEQKKGMGEDALLGYTLHHQSPLYYHPELLFYHNDENESHYSLDHFLYARRVLFSRLFMSLEVQRLNQSSGIPALFHYHWYSLFRIGGYVLNFLKHPDARRKNTLLGSFRGWLDTLSFKFERSGKRNQYWMHEASQNINL
jgi:glycosyltransferase involved in cell wall biosynthesis